VQLPQPLPGRPVAVTDHADLHLMRDVATGRLICTFVRHPLDWWRSYWGYRVRDGWTADPLDSACASDDFDEFARAVAEKFPGYASNLFGRYLAAPGVRAEFVGRYEKLVDDTRTALRLAGEPFDGLNSRPQGNANDYARTPAFYRRGTARRLAHAERAVIDRFYRSDPVPRKLVRRRLRA